MLAPHLRMLLCGVAAISMLSACAVVDKKDTPKESPWFVRIFEKDGQSQAEAATLAYSQGQFEKTLEYTTEALKANPRNSQALLVGALAAEKLGRYNKARQYYEDLIVSDAAETSILGSSDGTPQKIADIAKNNLRTITIVQSNLTIENRDGSKYFAISESAGTEQSKSAIAKALSKKEIPAVRTQPVGVDDIFTPSEQNIVSRFLILKELAEKDFITKDEFLSRRTANIGGLLPLTHRAPGIGIDQPVPSPDLIIERLDILKEGVENRAITPREFSAERDVIIEALMSPSPRQRLKNKAPSKNILDAANDLRRLEVLYNLDLITENEKNAEKKAVERYLGINKSQPQTTASTPAPQPASVTATVETPAEKVTVTETVQPEKAVPAPVKPVEISAPNSASAAPAVSSPF